MADARTVAQSRDVARILVRNSLVVTAGGVVLKVLNVSYTLLMVRLLGEVGFGQYSTVIAFCGIFGVFFELGVAQYVQRSIAQDSDRVLDLFWNLVAVRLLLAVAGSLSIVMLAVVLGYSTTVVLGVFLLTATYLPAAFLMPLMTVLTANERFDVPTVVQIIGQLLTIGLGLALLSLGQGFLALLYTGWVVMPIQVGLCVWAMRRTKISLPRWKVSPRTWIPLVRASLPFGLTAIALTYNFSADAVILGYWHGDAVVGWYSAAYRLVFNLVAMVGGFLVVITPSLTREYMTDPARVGRIVRLSVQGMMLLSLPAAVGVSILAGPIVRLLYGDAYEPSGPILALICWDVPLLLFNAFCGNVTAAIHLEREAARIYLLSAVVNVGLNLLLIPLYGAQAAALATLVSDGLSAVRFVALLHQPVELGRIGMQVARVVLATVLMGAVVWMTRSLELPLSIIAGGLSFSALAVLLRLVEPRALITQPRRLLGMIS
ncbi:MAG: flippase [Chloroflexi bacterium]|nr:flippase [Chloroflexota bacterium]